MTVASASRKIVAAYAVRSPVGDPRKIAETEIRFIKNASDQEKELGLCRAVEAVKSELEASIREKLSLPREARMDVHPRMADSVAKFLSDCEAQLFCNNE